MKNIHKYVMIDGDQMLKNFHNEFIFISQMPYAVKTLDDGTVEIQAGVRATLQIIHDDAPEINKKTGEIVDNRLEVFEATIIGVEYPLPFKKGCMVKLGGYKPEISYVINYNAILRFSEISEIKPE